MNGPVPTIVGMRVDIWSDYVCPWCYLSTDTARWLEEEHGCEVVWHPFELHPEVPLQGLPVKARSGNGGRSGLRDLLDAAGLPIERPSRIVNSHAALQVGELARAWGVFDEWHRRAFAAYFCDGLDLSDEEVLRAVGEEAGIDPDDVSDALCRRRYGDAVDASKERALDRGIGGTPGFVFDRRLVVPGVQSRAVFERILSRMRA